MKEDLAVKDEEEDSNESLIGSANFSDTEDIT